MQNDIERQFRLLHGKVLASLISKGFEITLAEDAVASAFESALQLPTIQNLEPWIHKVALHRAIDAVRKQRTVSFSVDEPSEPPNWDAHPDSLEMQDERIRLFFLCTHPAIHSDAQIPLMLQLVLGLTAESIAEILLLTPATVSQRLVRAKKKVRDAGIMPSLPGPEDQVLRLPVVLETIYGLYCRDWAAQRATEAIDLAESLAEGSQDNPEGLALLALLLFSEARRQHEGQTFVPLRDQNPQDWQWDMIQRAEHLLAEAATAKQLGRFQLEAAIHSAEISRIQHGFPDGETIFKLYEGLVTLAPTIANRLGYVAAVLETHGAVAASLALKSVPATPSYLPYLAVSAHVARSSGDQDAALAFADQARLLSPHEHLAAYWAKFKS